jgi:hypothetical protein
MKRKNTPPKRTDLKKRRIRKQNVPLVAKSLTLEESEKLKKRIHPYFFDNVQVNGKKVAQNTIKRMFGFRLMPLGEGKRSYIIDLPKPEEEGTLKYDISDMSIKNILAIQGYKNLLTHIVEKTEARRAMREIILKQDLRGEHAEGILYRGRPRKEIWSNETYTEARIRNLLRYKMEITAEDIEDYFVTIMAMGIRQYSSIASYFDYTEDHVGSDFIQNTLRRFKFDHISMCIDYDIDNVEDILRRGVSRIYTPSHKLARLFLLFNIQLMKQ